MRQRICVRLLLVALEPVVSPLRAQKPVPLKPFTLDETPVRRAEPVSKPPAAPPVPVATPIPVAPPVPNPPAAPAPAPTPTPVPPAVPTTAVEKPPVRPPAAKPDPKPAKPAPLPDVPDPTGEIRITPSGTSMSADQIQLSIADSYYARQMFEMAAPEYEKYLGLYPNSPERPVALFRLAESYRRNGTVNAAKNTYETLLAQFSGGEFVGAAAYRLAELYYQEKNYSMALPMYRKASVRLREPRLANMAKFYTGRTLEGLGQKLDARMVYEDLVATTAENPFIDASRLSLAVLLKDAGRTADALKQVQLLAKNTENPDLKAEATVRSGLWELELKQTKKAEEDLQAALQMPGIGRWKDVAQIGLLQIQYNEGKYQAVIDSYSKDGTQVSADSKPQILLLVGNAYRQLNQPEAALKLYDQLVKEAPSSIYARDSAYERMILLYQMDSPNLLPEIDQFLAANPDHTKRDQVQLMKAEVLFKKQDYAAAAPIYDVVAHSRQLAGNFKAKALYKLGWCSLQIQDVEKAIRGFTELIDGFPTSESLSSAYFHRAIARLRQKDLPGAVKDLDALLAKFPKAKEREPTLEQKAIIQGQRNDNSGMADTYKLLLKEFPKTAAAADANYWIGWVAFENKAYKDVPAPLSAARELDKEKYFERSSLRILLAHFYTEDWNAAAREIDYYVKEGGKGQVPEQVLRGVAMRYYEVGERAEAPEAKAENFTNASRYLEMLAKREEARPDDFLNLGRSNLQLGKFAEAIGPLETYLKSAKQPAPRCLGLLALARARIAAREFDAAQQHVTEALSLQADGRLNAEAQIVSGDIKTGRGDHEEAAKIYESVSVIIDDEDVTPRALEKAVESHRKAGNETDARRLLNTLQSRYPEYSQRKKLAM